MVSIHTNLLALSAQQHGRKTQAGLESAMTRLASGLSINSAKDDAAGLAIANRMTANIRADAQVTRGINEVLA